MIYENHSAFMNSTGEVDLIDSTLHHLPSLTKKSMLLSFHCLSYDYAKFIY